MAEIKKKKASTLPIASSITDKYAVGVQFNPDGTVGNTLIPYNLLLGSTPVISAEVNVDGELVLTVDYQKIEQ